MQKYGIWFIGHDDRILEIYQDHFMNKESAVFWANAKTELTPEYKNYILKELDNPDEI